MVKKAAETQFNEHIQMENAALDLRGKTAMLLAWNLCPKTKQEELMTSGVFGVFPHLSVLHCKWLYLIRTGATKNLQFRKREETDHSWVFRNVWICTYCQQQGDFHYCWSQRTPWTDSYSESISLRYRGAVGGNTDSFFSLKGCQWHNNLLLSKNNMVWWLETK